MLCGSSIPYVICSCGGTLFNKRCRKCNIKLCFDCVLLQDGFVTCAIRTCPVLSCQSQTRRNGTCCPVCQGIVVLLINQLNLVLKLQVNYRTVSTEHGSYLTILIQIYLSFVENDIQGPFISSAKEKERERLDGRDGQPHSSSSSLVLRFVNFVHLSCHIKVSTERRKS